MNPQSKLSGGSSSHMSLSASIGSSWTALGTMLYSFVMNCLTLKNVQASLKGYSQSSHSMLQESSPAMSSSSVSPSTGQTREYIPHSETFRTVKLSTFLEIKMVTRSCWKSWKNWIRRSSGTDCTAFSLKLSLPASITIDGEYALGVAVDRSVIFPQVSLNPKGIIIIKENDISSKVYNDLLIEEPSSNFEKIYISSKKSSFILSRFLFVLKSYFYRIVSVTIVFFRFELNLHFLLVVIAIVIA